MNKEIIDKILLAATRAPSGDNVQPWKFVVSDNFTQIDLYNLPEKDDSIYNYQQLASYIAHGAVIENIDIASKQLGCHADVQLFPDRDSENLVARIAFSECKATEQPLYPAIFNRQTNRFPYKKIKIKQEVKQRLLDTIKKIDSAKISLVDQQDKSIN